MQMDVIRIRKKLKKKLDEQRYEHTLGVAFTARLCKVYAR